MGGGMRGGGLCRGMQRGTPRAASSDARRYSKGWYQRGEHDGHRDNDLGSRNWGRGVLQG